jgi:hypothetical protein
MNWKLKEKLSLGVIKYHAMKTRGGGVYLHYSQYRHYMDVSDELHPPAAFPGETDPVPIVYEGGWASEQVLVNKIFHVPRTPTPRSSSP